MIDENLIDTVLVSLDEEEITLLDSNGKTLATLEFDSEHPDTSLDGGYGAIEQFKIVNPNAEKSN